MKITKEAELNSDIKQRGITGAYLLHGSESYLIGRWKEKLTASFEEGGFNFIKLDGQELDINEVYDATQQLPLFAPSKCVLVSNIDIKKLVAAELKKLEQLLEELPEETVLIVTAPFLDGKAATAKKLVGLFDSHGVSVEFSPRDTQGIVKYLQSIAKKRGCSLESGLAKEMIRLCGNELQTLTTELEKVIGYTGEGEITLEKIAGVVTPNSKEKVFDLSKMILAGNTQRAMEIVSNLLYLRESPVMIVSTLIMSYVDLYRARVAKNQGKNTADVSAMFNYKGREFRVRNAFGSNLSTKNLRKSLELLYQCDRQMKSTSMEDSILLEKTVIALIYLKERQP